MKYFIGYVIKGEAGEYLYNLTREISTRFNVFALHKWAPPHITLKIPFDTPYIDDVSKVIEQFTLARADSGLR